MEGRAEVRAAGYKLKSPFAVESCLTLRMGQNFIGVHLLFIIAYIKEVDTAAPSEVDIRSVTPIYTSGNKVGLNISWAQPHSDQAITSYKVQYRRTGNWLTETVPLNSPQTSYQLENLAVGTEYSIRVRAVSDTGVGKWSKISVATTFYLLSLSSVRIPSHTTSSLYLQWSSGGADDFILYYWKARSPLHVSSDTTKSSLYNITGLDSNTAYKIIVSARNPLGSANISIVNSTLPAAPSKVVILSVKPVFISHDKRVGLQVSWTPPQSDLNITSYKVQSRPHKATKWATVTVTVTGQLTQRSHKLENLAIGTEYRVRVRAVSDAGAGEWSEISVATTLDLSLSAPHTIKPGAFGGTENSASPTVVSQKIDSSKSRYMILQQSQQNNEYLTLNYTEHACFGQVYTLNCITSLDKFSDCNASHPTWFRDNKKLAEARERANGYSINVSSRESILQINVTKSNFNMNHTFHCAIQGTRCGTSFNVTVDPLIHALDPYQLNATSTSSDITLTWEHNKACFEECTFNVSRQDNGTGSNDDFYADTTPEMNYTFKGLTPSTTYILTVLAVCDNEYNSSKVMNVSSTKSATTSDNTLIIGAIVGPIAAVILVILIVTLILIRRVIVFIVKNSKSVYRTDRVGSVNVPHEMGSMGGTGDTEQEADTSQPETTSR